MSPEDAPDATPDRGPNGWDAIREWTDGFPIGHSRMEVESAAR